MKGRSGKRVGGETSEIKRELVLKKKKNNTQLETLKLIQNLMRRIEMIEVENARKNGLLRVSCSR